jgi:hypothetical protein
VAQAINCSILTGSLRMRVPIPFQTIHRVKANPGHYTGFPTPNFFRGKQR